MSISSNREPRYSIFLPRYGLQPLGFRDRFLAAVRLEIADDHVDAGRFQLLRLFQHLVGLADARGIAHVDLQFSARCCSGMSIGETRARPCRGLPRSACPAGCPEARASPALAVADEQLRDPAVARIPGARRAGSSPSRISMRAPARCAIASPRPEPPGPRARDIRLLHVGDDQLAVKPLRDDARLSSISSHIGARRDADENPLMRAEMLADAVALQIIVQLVVHHVGRQHQRQFPQLRQPLLRCWRRRSPGALHRLVGGASTISISSALLMKAIGHRLGDALSGDRFDLLPQFLDVLDVDRCDHLDARVEQFLHVLPASRISEPGGLS